MRATEAAGRINGRIAAEICRITILIPIHQKCKTGIVVGIHFDIDVIRQFHLAAVGQGDRAALQTTLGGIAIHRLAVVIAAPNVAAHHLHRDAHVIR